MKVALVVGHRKSRQGAYGNCGISEYVFWDAFLHDYLPIMPDKHEYQIFYRDDKVSGYGEKMKHLHKRIDDWGAEVSVSFHFNASSNQSVHGHEILYYSTGGKTYAKIMDEMFDKHLDNNDRNIKKRTKKQRGGGFLSRGKSKCILIEPFFAAQQHRYIEDGEKRMDLAHALIDFFEYVV